MPRGGGSSPGGGSPPGEPGSPGTPAGELEGGALLVRRASHASHASVTLGDDNDGGYASGDEQAFVLSGQVPLAPPGTGEAAPPEQQLVQFIFCTECGARAPSVARFCTECGHKMLSVEELPAGALPPRAGGSSSGSFGAGGSGEVMGGGQPIVVPGATGAAGVAAQADGAAGSYDPFAAAKNSLRELVSPSAPGLGSAPASYGGELGLGSSPTSQQVYEVRLEPGRSGLSFDEDWLGKQLVVDDLPEVEFFSAAAEGDAAARAAQAQMHAGDHVLAINGVPCTGLGLARVEEILRTAEGGNSAFKVRLRTPVASVEEAFGEVYNDRAASEALSVIYRQKSAMYEPPEHMDMVYGYVLRYRGDKAISFHFYRESDNKFLLAACMPRSGKGRVVFHNDPRIKFDAQLSDVPVHSESARFLGSVVPNFFGTAFTMHDYRVDNPLSTRKRAHHELGFVAYQVNMFGRVPNTLEATLPRWDPEQGLQGQTYSLSARYAKQTQTRLQQGLGLLQRIKANKADEYQAVELDDQEDLLTFETKKPEWNEELQAWTLNFNGRVKMASKKNFLLVPNPKNEAMDEEFGSQTICLRFGKVLKDRFSLDYRHPISPFQAFAIALTSFSSKLVVT